MESSKRLTSRGPLKCSLEVLTASISATVLARPVIFPGRLSRRSGTGRSGEESRGLVGDGVGKTSFLDRSVGLVWRPDLRVEFAS